MVEFVQSTQLQLQNDEKLRGRVMQLARDATPLLGSGEALLGRFRKLPLVATIDLGQKFSPPDSGAANINNEAKLIQIIMHHTDCWILDLAYRGRARSSIAVGGFAYR
jgi:hypothetical protein